MGDRWGTTSWCTPCPWPPPNRSSGEGGNVPRALQDQEGFLSKPARCLFPPLLAEAGGSEYCVERLEGSCHQRTATHCQGSGSDPVYSRQGLVATSSLQVFAVPLNTPPPAHSHGAEPTDNHTPMSTTRPGAQAWSTTPTQTGCGVRPPLPHGLPHQTFSLLDSTLPLFPFSWAGKS